MKKLMALVVVVVACVFLSHVDGATVYKEKLKAVKSCSGTAAVMMVQRAAPSCSRAARPVRVKASCNGSVRVRKMRAVRARTVVRGGCPSGVCPR